MFRLLKAIIRLLVLILIAGALLLTYARYVEPRLLVTEDISLSGVHLTSEQQEFTVAAFADTHFSEFYTVEDFARAVKKINAMEPDFIFFLGDLIDNYNEYEGDTAEISTALAELKATYGKYAVFGNHDYGGGAERYYQDIMEAGGFTVLVNESADLDSLGLTIVGIDDIMIGYGDPKAAAKCRTGTYNIVLCHEPDIVGEMTDYDIDLMLAGHTHGGQINIPFTDLETYLPPYGKIYQSGLYTLQTARGTNLYVNRGLGTTTLPLRFRSTPELTKITLKNEDLVSTSGSSSFLFCMGSV